MARLGRGAEEGAEVGGDAVGERGGGELGFERDGPAVEGGARGGGDGVGHHGDGGVDGVRVLWAAGRGDDDERGGRGRSRVHPALDDLLVAVLAFEEGEQPEGHDELAQGVAVQQRGEQRGGVAAGGGEDGAAVVAADFDFLEGGGVVQAERVQEGRARVPAEFGGEGEGFADGGAAPGGF